MTTTKQDLEMVYVELKTLKAYTTHLTKSKQGLHQVNMVSSSSTLNDILRLL